MKKLKKYLYLMVVPAVLMAGCKGNQTQESPEAGQQIQAGEYDLSKNGVNLIIKAPAEPAVEQVAANYEVKANDDFQIQIAEGTGDMNLMKSDIQKNDVNKFKRFIVDEPEAILYESEITQPEFHFFVVKKGSNNTIYEIQDIKTKVFTEEQAKAMFDAAKAARAK
jgi:hypothetical protein